MAGSGQKRNLQIGVSFMGLLIALGFAQAALERTATAEAQGAA